MEIDDPLVVVDKEIHELRQKLTEAKARRSALKDERAKWPKLVRVNAGRGDCGDSMLEAFAEACGWVAGDDDGGRGPWNWTWIAAEVVLYYEVTEKGRVTLVGVYDRYAGCIGRTDGVRDDKRGTIITGFSTEEI